MTNSPLIQQVEILRAAQEARDAAELQRLINAYRVVYRETAKQLDALVLQISEMQQAGQTITGGQIVRQRQYKDLLASIEQEVNRYESFMRIEIPLVTSATITEGEQAARLLAELSLGNIGIGARFRAVSPAVIEEAVGFLDPRGPLYKRLSLLSGWTVQQVIDQILLGIGMGKNPQVTARLLSRNLENALGMGLTDSMRLMRTVQLWSYREANRASYLANSDVVRSWVWHAQLDGSACASCVAMHGTEFPLSEPLNDHHNGRCMMVPLTIGAPNEIEQGEKWFGRQNETMQRQILGPGKLQAWRNNQFKFAEVSGRIYDPVYGDMRVERSLKDLLGNG
jgi:hypothetical protein